MQSRVDLVVGDLVYVDARRCPPAAARLLRVAAGVWGGVGLGWDEDEG